MNYLKTKNLFAPGHILCDLCLYNDCRKHHRSEQQKLMGNKLNQLLGLLKGYFGLFLSITFGIFLFILFFQPFPIEGLEFNDRLIFIAGLSAIVFFMMVTVRISFASWFPNERTSDVNPALPVFLRGFSLLVLSSVAIAFYLRFVGKVHISFFIMLKVSLICLVAPVVLRIYDIISNLKSSNSQLLQEKKVVQKMIEKYEDDILNKSIVLTSETGTETMELKISDIVLIRSADNYVEVGFLEGDSIRKKLIRNTMKGIESQIKVIPGFVRCHRTCIVNAHYIEKLEKKIDSYCISLTGYSEKVPVSRQYLLNIRELL